MASCSVKLILPRSCKVLRKRFKALTHHLSNYREFTDSLQENISDLQNATKNRLSLQQVTRALEDCEHSYLIDFLLDSVGGRPSHVNSFVDQIFAEFLPELELTQACVKLYSRYKLHDDSMSFEQLWQRLAPLHAFLTLSDEWFLRHTAKSIVLGSPEAEDNRVVTPAEYMQYLEFVIEPRTAKVLRTTQQALSKIHKGIGVSEGSFSTVLLLERLTESQTVFQTYTVKQSVVDSSTRCSADHLLLVGAHSFCDVVLEEGAPLQALLLYDSPQTLWFYCFGMTNCFFSLAPGQPFPLSKNTIIRLGSDFVFQVLDFDSDEAVFCTGFEEEPPPQKPSAKIILKFLDGPTKGLTKTYDDQNELLLGTGHSGRKADIFIPGSSGASPEHALLFTDSRNWFLVDCKSRSGSQVLLPNLKSGLPFNLLGECFGQGALLSIGSARFTLRTA